MRNNILKNSRENKKKILPVFFTFLVVGMIFSFSYLALSQTTDSNTNIKGKDLSLNIYPSDTIQKEIQYTTTQVNNKTGKNETITKTRYKNTDIIKVTNSDFYIKDNGNVEINLDIERSDLGEKLSGPPGHFNPSSIAVDLNKEGYTFNGGSFDSSIVQDLRNELEDLSFSVLKGKEITKDRNIPKGLAHSPQKNTHSVKVVMNPDFSENYKYASFKLGSHSTNIDLTPSLTSYYSLQETSGEVIDSHGDNNALNFDVTRGATGIINNAFDFDGDNDVVDINDFGTTSSDLSFSLWVKTSLSSGREYFIGIYGDDSLWLGIDEGEFFSRSDEAQSWGGPSLDDGNWHHVVVTISGDTTKDYIDGNLVATNTRSTTFSPSSTDDVQIGNSGDGYSGRYMDGKIDEVGIWDKALNSTEVSTLYERYDTDNLGYPEVIEGAEAGLNVNTLEAGNVTTLSANLRGNLTSLGEETNVSAYFNYREEGYSGWTNKRVGSGYLTLNETGVFDWDTGLTLNDNTTYEYIAVVERENGSIVEGNIKTFTTDIEPYFTKNAPKDDKVFINGDNIFLNLTFNNPDSYTINRTWYEIKEKGETSSDFTKFDRNSDVYIDLNYTSYKWNTWTEYIVEEGGSSGFSPFAIDEPRDIHIYKSPEIEIKNVTNLKENSVKLKGKILNFNDFEEINYKFQYKKSNETDWINTSLNSKSTTGEFSKDIFNLNPNTQYDYRIFYNYSAYDDTFSNTTEINNFTPYKELNVNTLQAENITAFSSKLKGNATSLSYYDEVDVYFQYRRIG